MKGERLGRSLPRCRASESPEGVSAVLLQSVRTRPRGPADSTRPARGETHSKHPVGKSTVEGESRSWGSDYCCGCQTVSEATILVTLPRFSVRRARLLREGAHTSAMGNAASGLPFVVGEEVEAYPESPETCSWRMHRGTKRVSSPFRSLLLRAHHLPREPGCPAAEQRGNHDYFHQQRPRFSRDFVLGS